MGCSTLRTTDVVQSAYSWNRHLEIGVYKTVKTAGSGRFCSY